MKKNNLPYFQSACAALAMLAVFGANKTSAQVIAQDEAGNYAGWGTGTNYGFGFAPWVLEQTGTSGGNYTGFYLNKPGNPIASTNGNIWGIYANGSSGTNAAEAFRGFSNSLPVNATFKILWNNVGIGLSNTKVGGFNLRNGNNTNLQTAASFIYDGTRFSLFYMGGGSDSYAIYDGTGANYIGLPFESGPLLIKFTLLPGDLYDLIIENAAGTSVLWSTNNQPLVGSGTIDSVALYAFQTDGDQIFNNMAILPTPPEIVNLQPANDSTYVSTSSQLSFAVTSFGSTVSSNNIQLTLNGIVQTGANWTVFNSGTSSNYVILNTPLQGNIIYTGTITATDGNGNTTVDDFTFNTWLTSPYNIYVEADDYNYAGGLWLDNLSVPEPNQTLGQYDLLGSNTVDYLEYDLNGTNNAYRAGDLPQIEAATDVDHDNFAANAFQQYDLAYIQNGEWENYTRNLSNTTYMVYARMAGFVDNATMLLERTGSPTVSSTNQPRASLGTFVCPNTGGAQNWTFVPLKDFFSNPVQIRLPGTNTFRITDVGGSGSYNLNYLILVATTNAATLHPYLASGYPYPGVTGVQPDQKISFVIANPSSTNPVSPGSIQLFLNSSNVTSGISVDNNAAGATVNYLSLSLLPTGTNTLKVIFSDSTAVSQTNSWEFTVASLPVIPPAYALQLNGNYGPGFAEQIAKADDSATNIDFPPSVARAEAQLAGTLTNSTTLMPYANEALNNGLFTETNVINYGLDSWFSPPFFTSPAPAQFPDITAGTTNYVAMAASMYVQLSAGIVQFGVTSDDGFKLSAGPTPGNTNLVLGIADYGRGASETAFSFIVQTNGLYPMRLIYFKSSLGGGGVQLYTIDRTTGIRILLNDSSTPGYTPVYYALPTLQISHSGTNAVLTWDNPTYYLHAAPQVLPLSGYTNVPGATSPYTNAATGAQRFFILKNAP